MAGYLFHLGSQQLWTLLDVFAGGANLLTEDPYDSDTTYGAFSVVSGGTGNTAVGGCSRRKNSAQYETEPQ